MSANLNLMDDLFEEAEEQFKANEYGSAEPMLNQLVLKGSKRPEVFHMLGTVYYDQGKFNKAIRAFKRALEIDPGFTDSSIGLSIILNDLGKYDEGQKIFEEARAMLALKAQDSNPQIDLILSKKHHELGDLYFQHSRYKEALEEFQKAQRLSSENELVSIAITDCHMALKNLGQAIRDLKSILGNNARSLPARLRLGKALYDANQIPEAIEQWERALEQDPNNESAKRYLNLTQSVQVTNLNQAHIDL